MKTLEFRRNGNALSLAEHGDALAPGERILATIQITLLQLSTLFTNDDARRDVLQLFRQAYCPEPEEGPVETEYLHPLALRLRLLIIGAGMAANAFGAPSQEESS